MKFTVIRENLLKGLHLVGKAVNIRSPLPVLSNVLIKTEKGRLKLVASDLQITISAWVGAKIDEKGEVTVPAKILTEFANQIAEEKLEGSVDGSMLHLKTASVKANFTGMASSEFPSVPSINESLKLSFDSEKLVDALQKVQFAVATDEGRPVLTGVYMRVTKKEIVFACTDGFRMAEYKLPLKGSVKEDIVCVVPAKSFVDIIRSFAADSEKLALAIDMEKNVVEIKGDDAEAQVRMIEGEYPDYEAVVPDEFSTEIKIAKSELDNGIKLASIFSKEMGNMVKLVSKDGILMSLSQPTETGSNSTKMEGEIEGEDLEIAFNARYLLDFLNNVSEDEIVFKAIDPVKPGLFRLVGVDNYFYLVMPMKANW